MFQCWISTLILIFINKSLKKDWSRDISEEHKVSLAEPYLGNSD